MVDIEPFATMCSADLATLHAPPVREAVIELVFDWPNELVNADCPAESARRIRHLRLVRYSNLKISRNIVADIGGK